jgi:glycosyltransferase 2 family protein
VSSLDEHDHDVSDVVLFDPPPTRQRWAAPDILRLLIGLGLVGVAFLAASFADETIAGIEDDVVSGIGRMPDRLEAAVIGTAQIIATFVPLVVVGVVMWKRRWRLLLTFWLASIIASLLASAVVSALGERITTGSLGADVAPDPLLVASDFPTTTFLASAVAMVTIGVTYVPRRWRRAAWSWIVVLLVLRFLGPGQPPLDIWVAVAIGVVVGSVLLLTLGSPNVEPSPIVILTALREVGLDPVEVRRWDDSGSRMIYDTVERDGSRTFVKLRTPDDRSWDLLTRLYRAIRLRSSEVARPFSTLKRRVEHEALALRTVRDGGTRCPRVIGVGVTPGGAAFLVEEFVAGDRLSDLPAERFDDDLLRSVFQLVRAVHSTRTAHHNLTLDNMICADDGHVWLVDYDETELAADRRERARDVAELLVALSLVVGPQRSVAVGIDELGEEESPPHCR